MVASRLRSRSSPPRSVTGGSPSTGSCRDMLGPTRPQHSCPPVFNKKSERRSTFAADLRGAFAVMASSTSLPLDVVSIVVNAAVFDVPQVACMIAAPRYCPHEGRTPHLKPPLSAALQAMHDLPRLARDHPREHGPVASRQLCAMRTICHRGGAAAADAAAAHSRAALSRR